MTNDPTGMRIPLTIFFTCESSYCFSTS